MSKKIICVILTALILAGCSTVMTKNAPLEPCKYILSYSSGKIVAIQYVDGRQVKLVMDINDERVSELLTSFKSSEEYYTISDDLKEYTFFDTGAKMIGGYAISFAGLIGVIAGAFRPELATPLMIGGFGAFGSGIALIVSGFMCAAEGNANEPMAVEYDDGSKEEMTKKECMIRAVDAYNSECSRVQRKK
jgi:hypothetical protein